MVLGLAQAAPTKIAIQKASVPIVYFADNTVLSYGLSNVTLGINKTTPSQGETVKAAFDVGFNDVIMVDADKNDYGYGIVCNESTTCKITNTSDVPCNYNNATGTKPASCVTAQALIRLGNQTVEKGKEYGVMEFKLLEDASEYFFFNNSVVGLGPKSPFWPAVDQIYTRQDKKEYTQLSVSYRSSGDQTQFSINTQDLKGSVLTFNGKKGEDSPVTKEDMSPDDDFFTFEGAKIKYGQGDKQKKVNLCILNTENFLLAVPDYDKFLKRMKKDLCGKTATDKDCLSADSNIDRLFRIFVEISNGKQTFETIYNPVDYVWFYQRADGNTDLQNSEKAHYNIVDFSEYRTKCSEDASLAVGRNFLLKMEFIIRRFDKKFEIGFNPTGEKQSSRLLVIGGLLVLLIISIIASIGILQVCKAVRGFNNSDKDEFDDDDYERAEAGEDAE